MPTSGSDDPAHTSAPCPPTIRAHGHLVTGTGFLPERNVTICVTCTGEDVSDYLAYTTDHNGHLHAELPTSATGTLHIAATDHRLDPDGDCDVLWSNTCTIVVADQ